MKSINGFGGLYYGWHHAEDDSATATLWFCLSWIPIFPLKRHRLRVLSEVEHSHSYKHGAVISNPNRFDIIEQLPLSYAEILRTLVKTYIGIPAILIGPMVVLVLAMKLFQQLGFDAKPGTNVFKLFLACGFLIFLNFLWQCLRFIRNSSGQHPYKDKP